MIIYVREDIPCKRLTAHKLPHNVEGIFIELVINKSKWFQIGGYNPHKDNTSYFLRNISKMVDANIRKYEIFLLIGDFNADIKDHAMSEFCEMYNLKNLINEPTCYKNPNNLSSIDVILTNRKRSLEISMAMETGLSDHHKMIITVLKSNYKKRGPLLVNYRSYRKFDENLFRNELGNTLENLIGENMGYDEFKNVFLKNLNLHAPMKKKSVWGNNAPFMNHALSQAFMHRSKLKNIFYKDPTDDNKKLYNQQRNYCVSLLRKEKKKSNHFCFLVLISKNMPSIFSSTLSTILSLQGMSSLTKITTPPPKVFLSRLYGKWYPSRTNWCWVKQASILLSFTTSISMLPMTNVLKESNFPFMEFMLMHPISRRLKLFNYSVFKVQEETIVSVFPCELLRVSSLRLVGCEISILVREACRELGTCQTTRVPLMALMKLLAIITVPS